MKIKKHPDKKRICVFCGSSDGKENTFKEMAKNLGKSMADRNVTLIYGGGGLGLMGAAAKACKVNKGEVIGIIPSYMDKVTPESDFTYEKKIVSDLFERKKAMITLANAFVVLPGGIGSLDEIAEVLALLHLNQINKPIGFLSHNNYFEPLFQLFAHFRTNEFLHSDVSEHIVVSDDVQTLLDHLL